MKQKTVSRKNKNTRMIGKDIYVPTKYTSNTIV